MKQPHQTGNPNLLLTLIGCLLICGLFSCASYTTRIGDLQDTTSSGDFEAALEQVSRVTKPGALLYHLERGALLHYAGRFVESNEELSVAEELVEDLYTVSLSERTLTMLLNDEVEAYSGEIYERNYLHYYRLLNYIALEQPAEAAVEARKIVLKLSRSRDGEYAQDPLLHDDPFLELLAATVLSGNGEWNSALIACRHARSAFREWETQGAKPPPDWLNRDLLRYAARSGFTIEEIAEGGEFSRADWVAAIAPEFAEMGRILILFETGWTPRKESVHIQLPIFKDESDWDGQDGSVALGGVLAHRYRHYASHNEWDRRDIEIDYFLDVAIPALVCEKSGKGVKCVITELRNPDSGKTAYPSLLTTATILDFEPLVRHAFKKDEFSRLVKTFARALLKYIAQQKAKKELGSVAGFLANLAAVATEKADTRGWLTLPGEIQAAEMMVQPGVHQLRLEALDASGPIIGETIREVDLAPGETRIISWRLF